MTWRTCAVTAALALPAALALSSCRDRDPDAVAVAQLESDGYEHVTVRRRGASWDFTGKRDDSICSGEIMVSRRWIGKNEESVRVDHCELDPSACHPGVPDACRRMGDRLYERRGEKALTTVAMDFYATACREPPPPSGSTARFYIVHCCTRGAEIAGMLDHGEEVEELGGRGCALEGGDACASVGDFLRHESPESRAQALEWYRKGCDLRSGAACLGAAEIYGGQSPPDLVAEAAHLKWACLQGRLDACDRFERAKASLPPVPSGSAAPPSSASAR